MITVSSEKGISFLIYFHPPGCGNRLFCHFTASKLSIWKLLEFPLCSLGFQFSCVLYFSVVPSQSLLITGTDMLKYGVFRRTLKYAYWPHLPHVLSIILKSCSWLVPSVVQLDRCLQGLYTDKAPVKQDSHPVDTHCRQYDGYIISSSC